MINNNINTGSYWIELNWIDGDDQQQYKYDPRHNDLIHAVMTQFTQKKLWS